MHSGGHRAISGDRDTCDMQRLVSAMAERHKRQDLKPAAIYDLCREIGAFPQLVGDEETDMDNGKRNILSRIFSRFDGRVFPAGHTFRIYNGGGWRLLEACRREPCNPLVRCPHSNSKIKEELSTQLEKSHLHFRW